jgi:hypothetical protein
MRLISNCQHRLQHIQPDHSYVGIVCARTCTRLVRTEFVSSDDLIIMAGFVQDTATLEFQLFLKQNQYYHQQQVHCCEVLITFPDNPQLLRFLLPYLLSKPT